MTINYSSRSIQLTKKFAKAAQKFGSDEYNDLQAARRDNPTFKIVIVSRKTNTKVDTYKGLTYEYMENYIKKHDDAQMSIMNEYLTLRGKSDEAKEKLLTPHSYNEMKKWFLKKFSEIDEFRAKYDKLVAA